MKSKIIEPAGFCKGVKNALSIAKKALELSKDGRVYFEHDIVHNEKIISDLKILKDFSTYQGEILESKDVFIISAHGHDHSLTVKGDNYKMIDCFCPFLKKRFEDIAKDQSEEFFYLGEPLHPESRSTISFIKAILHKKVSVLANENELKKLIDSSKVVSASLIIQSTFYVVIEDSLKVFDRIYKPCFSASKRWEKIKEDQDYNTYIIVGSNQSSNTTALYQIAKEYHPDKVVLRVLDVEELNTHLSKIKEPIAVFSGTSVQSEVVSSINDYLLSI